MTQEEKAKAYDEAMKRAEAAINIAADKDLVKGVAITIFPELRESEDERIRKDLIKYLEDDRDCQPCQDVSFYDSSIAWLEKQKEQKPSINIDQLKSLMLQYFQEAANEKNDSDIQADTDKWARKILGHNFEQKEQTFESVWHKEECQRIIDEGQGLTPRFKDLFKEVCKAFYEAGARWQEKQKKQKSVEYIKFDNEFENQISHLIASVLNGEHEYNEGFVKYVAQSLLGYASKEQKSQNTKSEINFANKYSHEVWEKLMSKFKAIEGYQIGANDVSDIVLNAILNAFKWQKEQKPRKFKLGDKIHRHDDDTNVFTVTGFQNDAYLTEYGPILFCDEDNWERIERKRCIYGDTPSVERCAVCSAKCDIRVREDKQKPEVKLTGWVARDSEYNPYSGLGLILFNEKPRKYYDCWRGAIASQLPWESFPDLKWEDEPIKVEVTIRKK